MGRWGSSCQDWGCSDLRLRLQEAVHAHNGVEPVRDEGVREPRKGEASPGEAQEAWPVQLRLEEAMGIPVLYAQDALEEADAIVARVRRALISKGCEVAAIRGEKERLPILQIEDIRKAWDLLMKDYAK